MYLSVNLLEEVLSFIEKNNLDCVEVPEIILGRSWLARARRFERFIYCNSLIDSPRFIRRNTFERIGYFKPGIPGAEDWDLDSRIYGSSLKIGYLEKQLPTELFIDDIEKNCQLYGVMHEESDITLPYLIEKKNYYKKADLDLIKALKLNKSKMIKVFSIRYRLSLFLNYEMLIKYNTQYKYFILVIIYRLILVVHNRMARI